MIELDQTDYAVLLALDKFPTGISERGISFLTALKPEEIRKSI
jgi:hypothetical protein